MPVSKVMLWCMILCFIAPVNAQESSWKIDKNHSRINFGIAYFKVGQIQGVFENYSGTFIETNTDLSSINIVLKTASINTNQADRDKHLKTVDFFSAEEYPEIKFISTAITKIADNTYEIKGDFTMTGITKSIVLKVVDKGSYVHPMFKTTNKFITVSGVIKREDFNVGTNYAPAKFALSNEVNLIAEIHLTKEK